ncbi:DUF763 domain-containing protein [Candidatus Parcubacteria bacterium]|nr:DUF763 domain-containing protein [Candidatus Parcubacteria bacterium]
MRRGVATFTLDHGHCPPWLFERMVKLGREIVRVMVEEYGPHEFVARLGDPVWFQSLGTVLAFDWNASGLTTILTAALKESLLGNEQDFGIYICGGKGKTSRKTPEQIINWSDKAGFTESEANSLVYNSRMSAKVDSALVQDGFEIYHHCFVFSKDGTWTVVQQGMNTQKKSARRYHWSSDSLNDFIVEPHSGIMSDARTKALNMTAVASEKNRELSLELVSGGFGSLQKDLQLLQKHFSPLSKMAKVQAGQEQLTFMELAHREFHSHPVMNENFAKSKYLDKIFQILCEVKPKGYESLVSMEGVGPKTIRALSLVSEVIYGAPASYKDPARYSFAHGGKDATPYMVDRPTYDRTIATFRDVIGKSKLDLTDKRKILQRL